MVALANAVGADAYFTMPHTAEDDFVASMAKRVAKTLNPGQRVYVEYSNEFWNTIFDQHYWANRQGCLQFSSDPKDDCDPDEEGPLDICAPSGAADVQEKCRDYGYRFIARRTV